MSSRSLPVIVSPRARLDQEDIVAHGLRTWGEGQALAYDAVIDTALQELGFFPELGRPRDDIGRGCRSLPVGQHVLYYRIEGRTLLVLRILHARMDATGQVAAPEAP